MSAPTAAVIPPQQNSTAADPSIYKILDDGTILYKTYRQAAEAKQLKNSAQSGDSAKKLSQVKLGGKYLTKDGREMPYTLARLAEFQFTGLIVVLLVLVGLSLLCSLIGRLIKALDRNVTVLPAVAADPVPIVPVAPPPYSIHPGLTDQQLLVLLTAAAHEAIGGQIRIGSLRMVNSKGGNWTAQGRSELQTHRLK
ncbi:MAG: hypothetical protein PHY09_03800 [Desulfuromonadaceae bacterium]|nr:hypothetical protein [Desulfuromonadaceae bacterium]MDD5106704.1 hypothetical protein [Desulfuromonadaceae bacterium]